MATVWVVEQGEYSDYHVVGVFSSAENARFVADAVNAAEESYYKAEVKEWPLNPAVEELRSGLRQHRVLMGRDGAVEQVEPLDELSAYRIAGECRILPRSKAPWYLEQAAKTGQPVAADVLDATVWAKDDTHAVKIVNEKRAQMIASGEWN